MLSVIYLESALSAKHFFTALKLKYPDGAFQTKKEKKKANLGAAVRFSGPIRIALLFFAGCSLEFPLQAALVYTWVVWDPHVSSMPHQGLEGITHFVQLLVWWEKKIYCLFSFFFFFFAFSQKTRILCKMYFFFYLGQIYRNRFTEKNSDTFMAVMLSASS